MRRAGEQCESTSPVLLCDWTRVAPRESVLTISAHSGQAEFTLLVVSWGHITILRTLNLCLNFIHHRCKYYQDSFVFKRITKLA